MAGRSQDDEDGNSRVSDTPLQLPASAGVSSDTSAWVTFSQAESDLMRNAPSLYPIPSQIGVNPWQLHFPSTFPQGTPAVLGQRDCQIDYTTSTRSSECSARNGLTCFVSSTRRTSRCHSSTRSGCAAKSSQRFGKKN